MSYEREIDPRDCQHGHADSQQEEIDRLRAELYKRNREVLDAWAERDALLALLLMARNRLAREQRNVPVETAAAIGREIAAIDAALDAARKP